MEETFKQKLLKLLEFDNYLSEKKYGWHETTDETILFWIQNSNREWEIVERYFTKEEFEIIKKIFELS